MKESVQNFDVIQVPLDGKNLIEASAGTGKTYSVAIMVLRLILEKDIRINKILMVTFTKAAVAELEERVRRFVRIAQRYAQGEPIEDPTIKAIVDGIIAEFGNEHAQKKLDSAVINLDETSVFTIHSFCQQTLTEFAFETNQLFNSEMLNDIHPVLEETTQKFWREHITRMEGELLTLLLDHGFDISGIVSVISNHLDGKLFHAFDKDKKYDLNEETQSEYLNSLAELSLLVQDKEEEIVRNIENRREELIARCEENGNARKNLLPFPDAAEEFLETIKKKRRSGYIQKLFADILSELDLLETTKTEVSNVCQTCINHIFNFAIQEIVTQVERKKIQFNQMTFDDVITKLYLALNHTNPNKAKQKLQQDLIRGLRWKYQAVFIDEFQDTDAMQYQIFKKAFGSDTILFFIGDPKQSIYAWRKADIETYFEARRNVDNEYTMNTNFRSSKNLVDALNHFFSPTDDFDTFYYKSNSESEDAAIKYFQVTTPPSSTKGELNYNGNPVIPLTFSYHQKNEFILEDAVKQISDLLNNPAYSIKERGIKPSDIGVLVRSRREAQAVKAALAQIGIPAVTVTDARVLQSQEAQELVYVLDAIISHTRAKVNRVLTTSFINWTPDEILSLDEDLVIERFRNYLLKWQKNGIYSALSDFIHGFNVRKNLIGRHTENGERIITNLYHLMEVLYRTENRQHFSPEELLDWLKANRSKPDSNDDEMIQRIESDEESVRIVTIHSSKGLEYNIVIAPYLDFVLRSANQDKTKIISIRNRDGNYISIPRDQAAEDTETLYRLQSEQENRRLLYVALTRAVYKCFIYRSRNYSSSTLATFIDALDLSQTRGLIEEVQPLELEEVKGYTPREELEQFELTAPNFNLSHRNWTRTSYSRLAAHTEYISRANYEAKANEYDDFVFRELTKGAKTGTFIHDIFENIDFSDSENRKYAIARSIERFVPDKKESYPEKIEMFLDQVLKTQINTGTDSFSLSEIPFGELMHEMEFDFPLDLFPIKSLEQLIPEGITIKNAEEYPQEIEGIMTGFVDLFFRHNGKYYVLDWKTNYLGPNLSDYNPKAVAKAMSDNNYHLQYLIYTHAVDRYLSHRLGSDYDYNRDFGGVLYLFVRGMRNESDTGIFFAKPSPQQLQLMNSLFGEVAI